MDVTWMYTQERQQGLLDDPPQAISLYSLLCSWDIDDFIWMLQQGCFAPEAPDIFVCLYREIPEDAAAKLQTAVLTGRTTRSMIGATPQPTCMRCFRGIQVVQHGLPTSGYAYCTECFYINIDEMLEANDGILY